MKKEKKKIYHFRVVGHPIGRQEPQKGSHGWYTPAKTKRYYEHIRNSFQQLYPRLNDRTHRWYLKLEIYVKGKQYPDCSNVLKAVEDSLQGLLWYNDKQVYYTSAIRFSVKDKKDECVIVYAEMQED